MQLVKWKQRVYTLDSLKKARDKALHTEPRAAQILKSKLIAAAG